MQLAACDRTRTLWIDAVCINQADIVERSQQVAQMKDIYSNGASNLIYLGPQEATTLDAVQNLRVIREELVQGLPPGPVAADTAQITTPLTTQLEVDALVSLYSCPWFT